MQINRDNYEIFLIDHLEGNLEAGLEKELLLFLEANPDLNEEYQLLADATYTLKPEPVIVPDFTFLKKESTYITQDEMIASLEGDLDEEAEENLQRKLIRFPQYQRDYRLFQLSKLVPEALVFEGKATLKRKLALVVPLYVRYAAIAAVLVAFFLAGVLYFGSNQKPATQMASNINIAGEKVMPKSQLQAGSTHPIIETIQPKTQKGPNSYDSEIESHQELAEISPKKVSLLSNSSDLSPLNLLPKTVLVQTEKPQLQVATEGPIFLKPSEWLLTQIKRQIPEKALALADTLSNGGARSTGYLALDLMQKTTGITYQEKKNPENGTRGYSIVGRYFAYEKIIHP
jgi:hypothetical protein